MANKRFQRVWLAACAAGLFVPATLWAADPGSSGSAENPESFRIEITGSAWIVNTSGTIQSSGTPVDLVSDLGAQQQQPTFFGRFVFKPSRRQRIVVEGFPFAVNGYNIVNRTLAYRGQTFTASQTLKSSADVSYLFGGYQYDVLTGPIGHLGFSVGGAWLAANGTINALETGITASRSETVGLPLAGADFRIFPVPHHKLIDIEGDVRGMGLGSYGHYLATSAAGGVCLGHIAILAGYQTVNADIHTSSSAPSGVNVHLKGPAFSATWGW